MQNMKVPMVLVINLCVSWKCLYKHTYFGASMIAAFDKELKNLDIRLPFRRFGSLFAGGFLAHQFLQVVCLKL